MAWGKFRFLNPEDANFGGAPFHYIGTYKQLDIGCWTETGGSPRRKHPRPNIVLMSETHTHGLTGTMGFAYDLDQWLEHSRAAFGLTDEDIESIKTLIALFAPEETDETPR